ncbi:MAG: bifunctional folylpolyglutamate synthase/dihydrofolate synthase [Gemmatimonadota bacterium]
MGVGLSAAALETLATRTAGADALGLGRMTALLDALGRPHERLRVLHVAGTNGKGSVCAILDAVLRARGWRTARYTSPHLVDFRERVLVDGSPVAEEVVASVVARAMPLVTRVGASFFEATTAMAFEAIADAAVDLAIVEVGLGGRLDATNVVQPLVAGVTSIGLDHTEWLGDTTTAIAGEKAGIFKAGAAAVIGERDPAIAEVLRQHAVRHGADPVRVVGREWPVGDVRVDATGTRAMLMLPGASVPLHTPLAGVHQAQNAATALAMLDLLPAPWRVAPADAAPALRAVSLPGRFQRIGRWLLDVAHNPDGAAVLARTLEAVQAPAPVWVLLTVLNDKDWRGMMRALAPHVAGFVLTRSPTAPAARAWDPAAAHAWARASGIEAVLEPDFDAAMARAAGLGETVLVTGSFHTVGDALTRLPSGASGG